MQLIEKFIEEFEKTRFAKDGGSAFECSDYEEMYIELKEFIKNMYSQVHNNVIEQAIEGLPKKEDLILKGNLVLEEKLVPPPMQFMYANGFHDAIKQLREFLENLKIISKEEKLKKGADDFVEKFSPAIKKMSEE